jgi:hypothetical protein
MGDSKMRTEIDLAASIIPSKSCGVISIGAALSECDFLSGALWYGKINTVVDLRESTGWICQKVFSKDNHLLFRTVCYYKKETITLFFNEKQILYFILVKNGYKGKAFNEMGIGIGSTLGDLKKFIEFEYDSGDEAYYPSENSGATGIAFFTGSSPSVRLDEEDLFVLEGGDVDRIDDDEEIIMISIQDWSLDNKM